jgi:hypothetical protein
MIRSYSKKARCRLTTLPLSKLNVFFSHKFLNCWVLGSTFLCLLSNFLQTKCLKIFDIFDTILIAPAEVRGPPQVFDDSQVVLGLVKESSNAHICILTFGN